MDRLRAVVALACLVGGCSPSLIAGGPPAVYQQRAVSQQDYSGSPEGRASVIDARIAEWKQVEGRPCQHATIDAAYLELGSLQGTTTGSYQLSQDSRFSGPERSIYFRRYSEAAQAQISSQLSLADAYLSGQCLAQADALYRDIISTFTGEAFAGSRQRAQIGVDDVRSARQR